MSVIKKDFPILIPKNVDMSKWAVIACDQHTTDRKYWDTLKEYIGDSPSTLNFIMPEVYLNDIDIDEKTQKVQENVINYESFCEYEEVHGAILVERTTSNGSKRIGIVTCVDLEEYDIDISKSPAIRVTEKVVLDRIPTRKAIRANSPIELPHVILLYDDPTKNITAGLYEERKKFRKLYDFDLNMNGGHLTGYLIPPEDGILDKFDDLLDEKTQIAKYGINAHLLLAVGDGNHSMLTAKMHWEDVKQGLSEEEKENHPARYALVEIENIHDDAITFLPIYRNIYTDNVEAVIQILKIEMKGPKNLRLLYKDQEIFIPRPESDAETLSSLQSLLDRLKGQRMISKIEYVHDLDEVFSNVSKDDNCLGILNPVFPKDGLFKYVVESGALPKKSFSIGHENTKKYYLELKRIK